MDKIKEKRSALEAVLALVDGHIDPGAAQEAVMEAAGELMLLVHFDSCLKHSKSKASYMSACGLADGWLCGKAKALKDV